jgi:hypothetical protein
MAQRSKHFFTRLIIFLLTLVNSGVYAQHSVARKWNEILLLSIRNDRARPPVHARNLFQISAAIYDAWAAYDPVASTWLLGKSRNGIQIAFEGIAPPANVEAARNEAISYAAFRMISHRFKNSPGSATIIAAAQALLLELGYDPSKTSTNYTDGSPASLGNYIASSMIAYGLVDGSNEQNNYQNQFYEPVNPPLIMKDSGNPFLINPNRWQPLLLETFIDQSGNEVPGGAANFMGPEWGQVSPFALSSSELTTYERDGDKYDVYHDPGSPPLLQADGGANSKYYKWGFALVSKWGSHLDYTDGVIWDISPASLGNATEFPVTLDGLQSFYNEDSGGDKGKGRALNPKTGQPYTQQLVPRGDYTRVLAEFWADGPDSETPPGHWFTILNYVSDHPTFIKKFKGEGSILNDLEWDVKAYFLLGGAMHDAAIAAWGIKGWYDYVRPVSAIRYMARMGQSSDNMLANYSTRGMPLSQGFVEVVKSGDPLEGSNGEHIGKIKLFTWRGPAYVTDPTEEVAGVGWILAENWWPYQRPTFVTPPFAGYVSGHSTFSRAAAEVLTLLTGDEYFPGGMGEFHASKNQFLVFEKGPDVDIVLQWATYRDASDQCSLSRIWGGIHPPQDDIPGRIIGKKIGVNAFSLAELYFTGVVTGIEQPFKRTIGEVFPNPVKAGDFITLQFSLPETKYQVELFALNGNVISKWNGIGNQLKISTDGLSSGFYILKKTSMDGSSLYKLVIN